jgi:lysophospholipase L1-like esterase
MRRRLAIAVLGCFAAASVAAKPPAPQLAAGDHYVAMGSSFAAGPGVTTPADTPPNRCNRSADNYPRQVAARLGLSLTDVSCGGATTGHILGAWNELPPQIDALRRDTKLVTITIGGNDVGYIAGLFAASCGARPETAMCKGFAARRSGPLPIIDETAWTALDARLNQIAAEVRTRSPMARLVFADYLTIVRVKGPCDAVPLDRTQMKIARKKAARLAAMTAQAARRASATIIRASRLSMRHNACAKSPWMNGFPDANSPPTFVGYHPNLAGMTAVADSIARAVHLDRN